ncbi:MAG TPA: YihY/virulence factor BrkB family protein [Chitinophaga sp.]|uniref:YihY/virulence factor BrkB family protein n=1 Tax=Chitinophaga sp. TaxID=1869181 RepID=UPI002F93F018
MRKFSIRDFWKVLRHTGQSFGKDQVLRLSASLAFYTVFSLGPMMIVIIFLADLFLGREAVEGRIYTQVSGLIGSKAALQIQEVMKNATLDSANVFTAAVGFIALLIGATTIFTEIQETINSMWRLKVKYRKGLVQLLLSRLLSFSLVLGLGFLLLVSLMINALVEGFMDQLREHFPHTAIMLFYITNLVLTFVIIWFLFGIIYKVLPDALIRWKDVAVGAFFTTLLFMLGKFIITFYIGRSNIGSAYGAAGSLVVLLLWIYYSAIILYVGAEFTKFYALQFGAEIRPSSYAVMYQVTEVESHRHNVQENEKEEERKRAAQQKKDQ